MNANILIAGAGSAGVAAAVAAADAGCRVHLIESSGFAGGQACSALVGTVCGLYHRGTETARPVYRGFPHTFSEALAGASGSVPMPFDRGLWFLPYQPEAYRHLCDTLTECPEISVSFHTTVSGITLVDGRIREVSVLSDRGKQTCHPDAVVDASGSAVLSRLAELPLQPEEPSQTGGVVFRVGGLPELPPRALHLLLGTQLLRGVQEGVLSDFHAHISVVPGSVNHRTALIKWGLPRPEPDIPADQERFAREGIRRLTVFWKRSPELAQVFIAEMPAKVGIRSSRRPLGKQTLTGQDVLACKEHDDTVVRGAWPVEFWNGGARPDMQYLPEGTTYGIPAGALESAAADNLFFAGRALSADETAAASARVIGTCLATGTAAGRLAAARARNEDRKSVCAQIRNSLEPPHDG